MFYLSFLLLIPLLGMGVVAALPKEATQHIRHVVLGTGLLALGMALSLAALLKPSLADLQLVEHYQWNPRMGTSITLGVDGFSYPMVALTTLLFLVAFVASRAAIHHQIKGYYMLMLGLETATLGVFMAQDWLLFYLFWEMTLIPLFFLIDRWGGDQCHRASLNFVLYTMGGSVFMLIGLLGLMDALPTRTFDMVSVAKMAGNMDSHRQLLLFLGFLVAFGVKIPIFPIHGWLPLADVEAPSPVSILLSGILQKMGAYGLIRITMTLPAAMETLHSTLAVMAMVSLLYGGLLAWRQHNLKRMIAYSSISHMAVVLLGITTMSKIGIAGAVMQMMAHGLVAASLFLIEGLLYERTHTRDVNHYSSLIKVAPRFSFFLVLAFMTTVGLPGTAGFIAELHILIAGFHLWGWRVAFLTLGILITAAYAIRTVGRMVTGPIRGPMQAMEDMHTEEWLAAGLLAAGSIVLGIRPSLVLNLIEASANQFHALFVHTL